MNESAEASSTNHSTSGQATVAAPASWTDTDAVVGEILGLIARERASHLRRWCRQDVSMTAIHVLLAIEAHGPMPMSRLAEILDVGLSNATGIVTRLEERGLVRREHDDTDRRLVLVIATERGRELLEDREFMKAEELHVVLDAMEPAQRAGFVQALRDFVTTSEHLRTTGVLVEDCGAELAADPGASPIPATEFR